ncbi:hypothetical protein FGSG_09514 [Fusarium graminearum PH-1]|uniref:hypothetical protein n=1 Tax=Gibberella zeae (strain ATCC MYA-4620 / CBS 123657 / FGSC 9075 / NRRL 31084 / PH-1) TaxID=229533 RepID=UPI00021F22F4|nr:hypothetical protein FGSG_09514 [Fusarium graminearum PH-1]ESU16112.1 hypothetical protein FGSG_09514 [Fusarium graminearum PH-1]|eukprot:XP_011328204.1 hypothetical protein FGSG_09514 [Fusarium graminearum PH-1]
MNPKKNSGRSVAISKRKAQPNALDTLGENPTEDEIKTAVAHVALADLEERVADVRESWETDSLFEDAFEELSSENTVALDDPKVCTPEEASRLRRELREYGPAVFCQRTVDAGHYTARKLLSAFGIRPPAFLEGENDDAYFHLLSLAITRELGKRAKILHYNTVDDAVDLIANCNNIVLITGAGNRSLLQARASWSQ